MSDGQRIEKKKIDRERESERVAWGQDTSHDSLIPNSYNQKIDGHDLESYTFFLKFKPIQKFLQYKIYGYIQKKLIVQSEDFLTFQDSHIFFNK